MARQHKSPTPTGDGSGSSYDYYEISGPGESWAGRGRRQRHAQRQRARGAGMGQLGERFSNLSNYNMGVSEQARGIQGDALGTLGGIRGQYGGLANMYHQQAMGRGPSQAQAQLQQATTQNVANQQSLAAAGRGGNLAAQARQAQAAGAAAATGAAQQASQLRAQEHQAAMQGLSGAVGGQAAVAQQEAAMANSLRQQAQAAEMGYADMTLQHQLGHRALDSQAIQGRRNFATNLVGSILGGGGSAAGGIAAAVASDERVKQNVSEGGLAAVEAVGAVEPKQFEYKPGYGDPGQRIGVMAQDLEKTPAGATIVQDTPQGKAVDVGGMASLSLAATAQQQREINDLKKQVAAKPAPSNPTAGQSQGMQATDATQVALGDGLDVLRQRRSKLSDYLAMGRGQY